jgi:hypothetical protein
MALRNPHHWARLVRDMPAPYGVLDDTLAGLLSNGDEEGIVALFQLRLTAAQQELADFRESHPRHEEEWVRSGWASEERLWRRLETAWADGDDKLADRLEADLMFQERAPLRDSDDVELAWYRDELRSHEAGIRWWRRIIRRATEIRDLS